MIQDYKIKEVWKQLLSDVKAVLFDLDGTLADSMWVWSEIDHDFFRERNMPFPDNLNAEIEGMSFTETAEYFVRTFDIDDTVDELKQIWNDMALEKYRSKIPLKPGANVFLQYLKEQGIAMGIATSNSRLLVDIFLRERGLQDTIDVVVTSCDVNKGKPAPDVYLKTAELLQIEPEYCLVIEDIPMGIMAGHSAGMRVCAIADEYSKDLADEKREMADVYIEDYFDIFDRK